MESTTNKFMNQLSSSERYLDEDTYDAVHLHFARFWNAFNSIRDANNDKRINKKIQNSILRVKITIPAS